jgi:hypothetical protein
MGPKRSSKSTSIPLAVDSSTIVETTRSRRSTGGPPRGPILVQSKSHSGSDTIYPTDDGYEAVYQASLHEKDQPATAAPPTLLDTSISNGNIDSIDQNATIDHHDSDLQADPPTELLSVEETVERWTQKAKNSFIKTARDNDLSKALTILFNQKGKLDISVTDFTNLKLSQLEIMQVMQTYTEHPSHQTNQGDEPLQLVTGMSPLVGFFNKNDVRAFIQFSKKFSTKDIFLYSLTDAEARYSISGILKQNAKYIGLSADEAANWLTRWHHTDLA